MVVISVCVPVFGKIIKSLSVGVKGTVCVVVVPSKYNTNPDEIPLIPAAPVAPVAPTAPTAPVAPTAPCGPVTPVGPFCVYITC